ncbi:MAG: alternative ribosome rescue aminoacyl-tRNA hydrolase ArfB, partial [Kordiimonas sp.]
RLVGSCLTMIAVSENVKLREEEVSYRAVRASGPGGQHVNTTSSAIQLRFNAKKSPAITQAMFNRLRLVAGRKLNTEGVLTLRAEAHSSQHRNKEDAMQRLIQLLKSVEKPQKHRKTTRPTKASKERRLSSKAQASALKKTRSKVKNFD